MHSFLKQFWKKESQIFIRNIKVAPYKVSCVLLSSFLAFGIANLAYLVTSSYMNVPYAINAEICISFKDKPRKMSTWRMIIIQMPNFVNFAALLVDIMLVNFIRKTVLPNNQIPTVSNDIKNNACQPNQLVLEPISLELTPKTLVLKHVPPPTALPTRASKVDRAEKIPIQATLLSSILIFPFLFVYILSLVLNMEEYNRAMLIRTAFTLCNALR